MASLFSFLFLLVCAFGNRTERERVRKMFGYVRRPIKSSQNKTSLVEEHELLGERHVKSKRVAEFDDMCTPFETFLTTNGSTLPDAYTKFKKDARILYPNRETEAHAIKDRIDELVDQLKIIDLEQSVKDHLFAESKKLQHSLLFFGTEFDDICTPFETFLTTNGSTLPDDYTKFKTDARILYPNRDSERHAIEHLIEDLVYELKITDLYQTGRNHLLLGESRNHLLLEEESKKLQKSLLFCGTEFDDICTPFETFLKTHGSTLPDAYTKFKKDARVLYPNRQTEKPAIQALITKLVSQIAEISGFGTVNKQLSEEADKLQHSFDHASEPAFD